MEIVCKLCGKIIRKETEAVLKDGCYLCSSCAKQKSKTTKEETDETIKKCEYCGATFTPKRKSQKYCNPYHKTYCKICNKEFMAKTSDLVRGKGLTCSSTCATELRKQTNQKKYGVDNPMQSDEIKQKAEQTMLERYGAKNASQVEEFQKKKVETSLKNWGTENPMQNESIKQKNIESGITSDGLLAQQRPDVKDKIKRTNMARYGTKAPAQNPNIKEKARQTNLERYGVEWTGQSEKHKRAREATMTERYGAAYPMQSPELRERIQDTNVERYGVKWAGSSDIVKKKIAESNLNKYGVASTLSLPSVQDKIRKTLTERYGVNFSTQVHLKNFNDWKNLEEFLKDNKMTCLELVEYFNVNYTTLRKRVRAEGLTHLVKDFYKLSEPEDAFISLLKTKLPEIKDDDYVYCDREVIAPYEIDFYFPKHKLGVEISPSYTHEYSKTGDKRYHYNKLSLARQNDIELITVFDWHDLNKIVDFIASKMTPLKPIYARNCDVVYSPQIKTRDRQFIEANHILGNPPHRKNSVIVRLMHENEIVGLTTFLIEDETRATLTRQVFHPNVRVIGGASKMFKAFIRQNPTIKEITTFSDNDLGDGSVYNTLGFKLIEERPYQLNYWNEKHSWRIKGLSLVMQGADRLLSRFPDYEPVGMGEGLPSNDEIVMSYGFIPVYDCGYRKWLWTRMS